MQRCLIFVRWGGKGRGREQGEGKVVEGGEDEGRWGKGRIRGEGKFREGQYCLGEKEKRRWWK